MQIRSGRRIGMDLFFSDQHTYCCNYFYVVRIYGKIDSVDINTSSLSEIVSLKAG